MAAGKSIPLSEVSTHKSKDDLWIVIHGKGESNLSKVRFTTLMKLRSIQCYEVP